VEDRQQDDPLVDGDPIGDPNCAAVQVKSQFAQLTVELLRVGLAQQRPLVSEQIDVERRVGELSGRQAL
jgi:hypothetical protein